MYVIYAINKNNTYCFSTTDLLNFEHTRESRIPLKLLLVLGGVKIVALSIRSHEQTQ